MKRQFFSGNTLEQAVVAAARHFEIEPERVAFTMREKKHGFLKVGRRFVIEVDPEAPELPAGAGSALDLGALPQKRAELPGPDAFLKPPEPDEVAGEEEERPAPPAPDPGRRPAERERAPRQREERDRGREPREPRGSERGVRPREEGGEREGGERMALGETASIERAVRELLRFLDVRAEIEVVRQPDHVEVEILDSDSDVLLDGEGKVLQAMEYLVPRMVRGLTGQGVPVRIDCEGFREDRERELQDLAREVADEVREDGEAQLLEPMSPGDRRLIHLALADDPDVETESEGRGYYKRVRISPIGGGGDTLDDSRA